MVDYEEKDTQMRKIKEKNEASHFGDKGERRGYNCIYRRKGTWEL